MLKAGNVRRQEEPGTTTRRFAPCPTLRKALDDDGVSVIACPVDYSENMKLTAKLGVLGTAWPHAGGPAPSVDDSLATKLLPFVLSLCARQH